MAAYYTYDETSKILNAAPGVLNVNGVPTSNPPAFEYAKIGAYPLSPTPVTPDVPEGKIAVFDGYELVGDRDKAWRRKYRIEDAPPPPPRTFSKLKIVAAFTQAGVWSQVRACIEQAGLYDLYLAAQDFAEDNEFFAQGKAALQQTLGWTDAQADALLAQCVRED